jgi:formate hydrogenlyase subunit 4
MNLALGLVAQFLHIALVLAGAPTLVGVCRWMEARLAGRSGPSVLQHWRDLLRLLRKQRVVAESASSVSAIAPLISVTAIAIAAFVIPSFTLGMTLAPCADLLVIAGLLALARGSLALAGMDAGTAFGGMGASRMMVLGGLSEPALLLAIFALALLAGSLNLDLVTAMQQESDMDWRTANSLAFAAIMLVAWVDGAGGLTDRAVLTMRRQATALEFSGHDLALIEAGDALRLLLWLNLIGAMFLPFGMAPSGAGPVAWLVGLAGWLARTLLFAVALAVLPTIFGRVRLMSAVQTLGIAMLLALLAMVYLFAEMGTA